MRDVIPPILQVIAVLLAIIFWFHTTVFQPQPPVLKPEAGKFITLDNPKISMYITRMGQSDDNKPSICFIQRRVTGEFFENCVYQETMDDMVSAYKGYITTTNLYPDRM